jgi:hypothetical protein
MNELDSVVLRRDLPDHGLAAGDLGTVVFRYPDGRGLEVEFLTADGRTVVVLTLDEADLRKAGKGSEKHLQRKRFHNRVFPALQPGFPMSVQASG